jgi:hypothetical protein
MQSQGTLSELSECVEYKAPLASMVTGAEIITHSTRRIHLQEEGFFRNDCRSFDLSTSFPGLCMKALVGFVTGECQATYTFY